MRSAVPEPVRDPLPGALFFRAIRGAPLLAGLRRRPRLAGRRAFRRRLVLQIVADHALDRASRENRTLLATDGKGDGAERHAASPGYGAGIVVPGSEGSCPASQSWPREDRIPSPEAYAIVRSASCRSGAGRWRCLRASYPRRPQAPPSARTEPAAERKGSIRGRLGYEARGYCPSSNAIHAHRDASRLPGRSRRHLRNASAYTGALT